jgi:hypothetical protein
MRLMTTLFIAMGAFAAVTAAPMVAFAADPVALIEEAPENRDDIIFMDFAYPGTQYTLAATETLVLGYMSSCMRETITGGTVKVGADQSEVTGGKVKRETVTCDNKVMDLASNDATEAGVAVFRGYSPKGAGPAPSKSPAEIQGTVPVLQDLVPIIKMRKPPEADEVFTITKLGSIEGFSVPIDKRGIADLRKLGVELEAGERYTIGTQKRTLIVEVSYFAVSGGGPLERLIVF